MCVGSDLCATFGIDFLSFTPRCLLPLGPSDPGMGNVCRISLQGQGPCRSWRSLLTPPHSWVGVTFVLVSFLSLGAHKIPRLKAWQGHRKAEEKSELCLWGGTSGDKGRMLTNENISKTVKTKTAKTKPKMPSKFQKVNKNKLGSQSLKHL